MAGFSELVKNIDKIRDYTRDFLVYGYKCRNDYTNKSNRSYDNERRRIESYLSGHIEWENTARGKNLFIRTNGADVSTNPLFSVWEAKSFTNNDCLLHFCLFDILREHPGVTAAEATSFLCDEYLACFSETAAPDAMTVRNKLNEYAALGLFKKEKQGKALLYSLADNPFEEELPAILEKLATPLHFFEAITPAGVLGYFARRDAGQPEDVFSFRHLFTFHTLDDAVLLDLLAAIQARRLVRFENCSNRSHNPLRETILPLRIASNVRHGRRYLLAYNLRRRDFFSFRLDYIKNVELLGDAPFFDERLDALNKRLATSWGVFVGHGSRREQVEMVLQIDEVSEAYVLHRLEREGKHGTVERLGDNIFAYRIEVSDTQEMVPWLRTFIGRIRSIRGSNRRVIDQFIADMAQMAAMYDE
ncbi:WYL domain-containing protein [Azotosporobacter soli]|uniref:helix-turn-helix transcriptional regulator n=1 Tax=Azotosporobacter soli TaxID=3055040 RepID=UPI0031FEFCB1